MHKKLSAAVLAIGVSLVAATSALGASSEYSVFAQCPTSNSSVTDCVYAHTESGEFTVGSKTVPITKAITLQGGVTPAPVSGLTLVAASNGETLSKAPQSVPGGLAGLVNCPQISNFFERLLCESTFENGLTGVTATTELAGQASNVSLNTPNLLVEEGVALVLPVKVHLENPFLGSECYVGSNASPIELNLTTGTTAPPAPNQPIKGSRGELSFGGGENIVIFHNNALVDNSFAAPGANGCGGLFSFLIDPIINADMGLPSAAGHNTAILKGTLEVTSAEAAKENL
jgi:hypothetical protein